MKLFSGAPVLSALCIFDEAGVLTPFGDLHNYLPPPPPHLPTVPGADFSFGAALHTAQLMACYQGWRSQGL